jgi:hypothetical protein
MKKLLALGAVLIAPFITQTAFANFGGTFSSFNATNVVNPSTAINSYPTNSQTLVTNATYTNSVGQFTGNGIDISEYDNIGLCVQGLIIGTNIVATNVIGIGYVTSMAGNAPVVASNTNLYHPGTNISQCDWSSTTNWVVFTLPPPATSNAWFNVQTNLANSTITASATYIGIVSITNNGFLNGFITNFSVGVCTKQVPRVIGY